MNQTLKRIIALLDDRRVPVRQRRRTLEEITGVSYSGVSQWFSGSTKEIEYRNLKAIADHFNVSVSYLMGEDQGARHSELDARLTELWADLSDSEKKTALQVLDVMRQATLADK